MPTATRELALQQPDLVFAEEVFKGKSLVDAYKLAFPDTKATQRSLYQMASQLFDKLEIRLRYQELLEAAKAASNASAERLVKEYERLALSDITQAISWDGNATLTLKASRDLPPDVTAAVSEVWQTKKGLRLKFHDKKGALDSLAKIKQLMPKESADVNVQVSAPKPQYDYERAYAEAPEDYKRAMDLYAEAKRLMAPYRLEQG